jgi:hypothetical protein
MQDCIHNLARIEFCSSCVIASTIILFVVCAWLKKGQPGVVTGQELYMICRQTFRAFDYRKELMKKNIQRGIYLGLYGVILACTACSQGDALNTGSAAGVENSKQEKEVVTTDKSTSQQINDAIADLAARTGVAEDSVVVTSARAVTWSSGALGCPEQGKSYTEALVPGLQVLLEASGTTHYYHGRNGMPLVYCPAERVQAPALGMGTEVM